MMRQKLAEAKVDVLVCIGNDHLHQFFMDNMPAFMIGKMEQYDGTFYDEDARVRLAEVQAAGRPRRLRRHHGRRLRPRRRLRLFERIDHRSLDHRADDVRPARDGYSHRADLDQLHRAADAASQNATSKSAKRSAPPSTACRPTNASACSSAAICPWKSAARKCSSRVSPIPTSTPTRSAGSSTATSTPPPKPAPRKRCSTTAT